jgi:hypothetical protein
LREQRDESDEADEALVCHGILKFDRCEVSLETGLNLGHTLLAR